MISMIPNQIDEDLKSFCDQEGISNHCYIVPKFASQIVITATTITEIINILCDKQNLPLYIHCINGGHTTGLVIMCLRKLQIWSQRAMFNEFNQFINTFESCEEEFVINYNATFELSPNRPEWLQHLAGKKSHPTLRVILTDDTDSDDDDIGSDPEESLLTQE